MTRPEGKHPESLTERSETVGRGRSVIQGYHEEHDVRRAVLLRKTPCVADRNRDDRLVEARIDAPRLFNQACRSVNEMHRIPLTRQPRGVRSGAPPTSTIRAGGPGSTRARICVVRANSSLNGPVLSRDSSASCS
jgi:hypothetical protein